MKEVKTEMREMVNQISLHHAEETTKKLDRKMDTQDSRIKKEIRDKFIEFDEQMITITDYCKKQMNKVQNDFQEDIRSMQKLRARDRSDYDLIFDKQLQKINYNKGVIDHHQGYFETFATSISLITENLNMQMEGENADINDRNIMSLYGQQDKLPHLTDHHKNPKMLAEHNKKLLRIGIDKEYEHKDSLLNLKFSEK